MSNIPKEVTQKELEDYLKELFDPIQIEKTIYAYEIYEIVENLRKRQTLEDKISKRERYKMSILKRLNITEEDAEEKGICLEMPSNNNVSSFKPYTSVM